MLAMTEYTLPPKTTQVTTAAKLLGIVVIAGVSFVAPPANMPIDAAKANQIPPLTKEASARDSRRRKNFSSEYVPSNIQAEARYEAIRAPVIKTIPTLNSASIEKAGDAESFYDRVKNIMNRFGLNKSQLSAVLNVQRKSIYDWQSNPSVEARLATVVRVQTLEDFATYMDNGHSRFLSKLAFGSLGHRDLAHEITKNTLNLAELQKLYDQYWLEFEGMCKRAKLQEATRDFPDESSKKELFISV